MPTAVLDLDLEELPSEIALPERYHWALILIRLRRYPIGQALLPVVDGHIRGLELDLRDNLPRDVAWTLWERWLHEVLEWEETPTEGPLPSATVAVCTRDRPEDLRRCLEALLRLPDDGQEVLVVDNCPSTDATWQVARQHVDGCGVRYVREDRPGLDCARNRALREAQHEIVAFIDDDAVADPGWLRAILRGFVDPQVLCVTGLTMPLELETESQEWFERYSGFGRGFKRIVYDLQHLDPLGAGRAGAGANMAFRRAVIDLLGPFDEALDAGTSTRTGGDTEMFYRVLKSGYRILYTPAALNWHRHRRTWPELLQALYGHGVGVYAFWTRCLLVEREFGVFKIAWDWFWRTQRPALVRAYRRRRQDGHRSGVWQAKETPFDLLWAEWRGCLAGPGAYLSARRESVKRQWRPEGQAGSRPPVSADRQRLSQSQDLAEATHAD